MNTEQWCSKCAIPRVHVGGKCSWCEGLHAAAKLLLFAIALSGCTVGRQAWDAPHPYYGFYTTRAPQVATHYEYDNGRANYWFSFSPNLGPQPHK